MSSFFRLADLDLGRGRVALFCLLDTVLGLVTPVLTEPFRDMLLVTELRDALELDLLRFSFELVGCLFPILEIVAAVPLVFVTLRAFLTFSVDL